MPDQPADGRFDAEVQRVRHRLAGEGRSQALVQLFDYLSAHSQDPRAPKEIEIALAVFGKDGRFDTSQDAMVRVYMHRLRGRLDEIYAGAEGARIVIPKGEYRIVLAEAAAPAAEPDSDLRVPAPPPEPLPNAPALPPRRRVRLSGWSVALVLLVLTVGAWAALFWQRYRAVPQGVPLAASYRNGQAGCDAATVLVGDTYLYFRSSAVDHSRRLIMRPTITSPAQLGVVRSSETAAGVRISDRDDYYVSADSVDGLWSLLASFSGTAGAVPAAIPDSKLTPQVLNRGDTVYFGRLDQLGLLHDNVFQNSRFALDPVADTLQDRQDRHSYTARLEPEPAEPDPSQPHRTVIAADYGYLARIPKPNGCALWIVAGLEDAALPQMARIAGDPAVLRDIHQKSGSRRAFEALFEFRSLGALRYSSRLLVARATDQ